MTIDNRMNDQYRFESGIFAAQSKGRRREENRKIGNKSVIKVENNLTKFCRPACIQREGKKIKEKFRRRGNKSRNKNVCSMFKFGIFSI